MMNTTRRLRVAVIAAMVAALLLPATARGASGVQRMYLLASPGQFLYWSFDPNDSFADLPTMVRRCGGVEVEPSSCYVGTSENDRMLQFSFNQMSSLATKASWNADAPLRFHFELSVEGVTPTAVQLVAFGSNAMRVSPPATQVSPGVWEGTITQAGTIGPNQLLQLSVRVRYANVPQVVSPTVRLGTAGASWVDLPTGVEASTLRELRSKPAPPLDPSTFRTELRTFEFNDRDWEAFSFEGDLAQAQDFTVNLPRRASGVMGVVEMFDTPAVYGAVRYGTFSPERVTDAPITKLVRDGRDLAVGANSALEQAGRGSDTVGAVEVAPGPLTLHVAANDRFTDLSAAGEDNRYRAYLIVMYGPRTLAGYRTRYMPRHTYTTPTVITPALRACSHFSELLPVSAQAAAVTASLSWDSANPVEQWTHTYGQPGAGYYPCGESGNGTSIVTFLPANPAVVPFGATMATQSPGASHRDVIISEAIDVLYRPAPAQ